VEDGNTRKKRKAMDSGELTVQCREQDQGRVEEGAVARVGKEGRARMNGE
jgi:hypothetical protein